MIYEPLPIGRICRECGVWKPRHLLRKNKSQPDGVEKHCVACNSKHSRRWDKEHPDAMKISRAKWRNANPDKAYEGQKHWRKANPERVHAIDNRWAKNHPDKARAKVQKRNARIRQLPHTFTENDWKRCLDYWHGCCAYCGNPPSLWDQSYVLAQDHFIPVTANGGYVPLNIVPACKTCNSSKWNNDPVEWLTKRIGTRKANRKLKDIQTYFNWIVEHQGQP